MELLADSEDLDLDQDEEGEGSILFQRREFQFVRSRVIELAILQQSVALKMIKVMGFDRFLLEIPLPALEEDLCREFIQSFSKKKQQGNVRGHKIFLYTRSIQRITGLPQGDVEEMPLANPTPEVCKILEGMFPIMRKSSFGYYLPEIIVENRDEFIAISNALMGKLLCRQDHLDHAPAVLLLALFWSIEKAVVYPWASFMLRKMEEAVMLSKERGAPFAYGEWFSGLICDQMSEEHSVARTDFEVALIQRKLNNASRLSMLQRNLDNARIKRLMNRSEWEHKIEGMKRVKSQLEESKEEEYEDELEIDVQLRQKQEELEQLEEENGIRRSILRELVEGTMSESLRKHFNELDGYEFLISKLSEGHSG